MVLSAIFFLFSCEQGITNDNTEYLNDLNGNLQFKSINTTDYEISGWYNDGWNTESHDIYMKYHNLFSIVNPYWYNLGTSTSSSIANGKIYERSYAFNNQEIIEIHNNGDLIIPAIGDVVQGQLNKILNSSRARKRLIDNLVYSYSKKL